MDKNKNEKACTMSKTNHIIIAVAIAVVFAGAGFWGGTAYAKGHATAARGAFASRAGGFGGGAGARGGSAVVGSVISSDKDSITIQTQNGSKIVFVSGTTSVLKSTAGSITDLTTGTNVIVTGTTNSDGSVTAQTVQVRPAGMMGVGGQGSTTQQGAPMIPAQAPQQ